VALARLGVEVAFVGVVGDDHAGREIAEGLEREGVDVSELAVVPGALSPQSTILVGAGTRAIVTVRGTAPLVPSARARRLCAVAEWVHVDNVGFTAAPARSRLSIDGGNPIDGLAVDGALYAPTEGALVSAYGTPEAALAAGALLVVVTRGVAGSAAYTADGDVFEAPAAPVAELVSTLGAGDVFHGALLAELVRARPLEEALATANLAAALSCRALDGRTAIPTLEELKTWHTALR
jgi:sugar/nucleoside kinase (ribokinase family)